MKDTILAKDTILVTIGEDHSFECSAVTLGRTGENAVSQLEITIPEELSGFWAYLDFKKPEGEATRTPRLPIVNNQIEYDVPMALLDKNGNLEVQLILQSEDGEIWKSAVKKFVVLKSIDAQSEIPKKEDFISEAQKILDETVAVAYNNAPALKGLADGAAISICDVSPLEHVLNLKADTAGASVTVCGLNLWDEQVEIGGIDTATGANADKLTNVLRSKNYIKVIPSAVYYLGCPAGLVSSGGLIQVYYYDKSYNFSGCDLIGAENAPLAAGDHWGYIRFVIRAEYGLVYHNDICLSLQNEQTDGTYEPYQGNLYTADAEGKVEGVKSRYPVTTLLAEPSVSLRVEYNREPNQAYQGLVNAITALGGSVESFVQSVAAAVPEVLALTIHIGCFGSSNQADIALYVDGAEVFCSSGSHDTQTFSYSQMPTSAYLTVVESSLGIIQVGTSWTDYTEYSSDEVSTVDLLSLGYTDIYIRHSYFD